MADITKTIVVDRPVREVYNQWTQFEDFPRFMEGVTSVQQLSDTELRFVLPGTIGPLLRDRARGIDPRDLDLESKRVSISTEETFERDISDRAILHAEIRRMADELAAHMQRNGISGRTVTAKLRYADFSIRSRSTTLPAAVDEA